MTNENYATNAYHILDNVSTGKFDFIKKSRACGPMRKYKSV